MELKKKVFVRIGAMMELTENEFALLQEVEKAQGHESSMSGISGQSYCCAAAMIKEKLDRGEYEVCGETYFPGRIDENEDEWFHEDDIDFIL